MDALREAAKWIGQAIEVLKGENGQPAAENADGVAKLEQQKLIIEQNGKLINGFLHLINYAQNNLNGIDAAEVLTNNAKKLMQAVV